MMRRLMNCFRPVINYKERVEKGEDPKQVLDDLKVERYCCRAAFLGQTDIIHLVNKFKKY